jgi:adenosylcobinamide kinase/adenosylcobinamide-phosphate guanylyltransferase
MTVTLVLGGARSGKSRYAQSSAQAWAAAPGGRLVYIATAEARDSEMAERIARHRSDRDARWMTIEAPTQLAGAIANLEEADIAVVDCLTLWLSNVMALDDHEAGAQALVSALAICPARLWLVSNEVGWGVVPDNALARAFRDAAGLLHQRIADVAAEVVLVTAGLPLMLKPVARPSARCDQSEPTDR